MPIQRATSHSVESANLADLLERILDKGVVIAGDIKINLVEVELLSLQIRLVVCSVDKARGNGHRLVGEQSRVQVPVAIIGHRGCPGAA